jgi:hypothetical protein
LGKYLSPNPFIFLPFNAGPRICLGQEVTVFYITLILPDLPATSQFAYQEVSFFLIRLLQTFSGFTLAEDAQPADSRPPAEWSKCKGTKGKDKIVPAMHITLYVKVRYLIHIVFIECIMLKVMLCYAGRAVGENGGGAPR